MLSDQHYLVYKHENHFTELYSVSGVFIGQVQAILFAQGVSPQVNTNNAMRELYKRICPLWNGIFWQSAYHLR